MSSHAESHSPELLPEYERTGLALPTWTYASEELLELEYQEFFLNSWQMVGHVCDLPKPGDFITFDMWRDSVFAIRAKDGTIRAFLNICRHRASRLLDGKGSCAAIQCPYHGWSYHNDGSLSGVPQPENFPDLDKKDFGLHEVQLEIYRGHIFVKLKAGGPSAATSIGEIDDHVAPYAPERYEPLGDAQVEVWECNWKLAWDNYQENYHIPIGHPCLYRMVEELGSSGELSSGVNYGYFGMREKLSKIPHERRYQEGIGCTDHRYPEGRGRRWLQLAMDPNMGIEYYPDLFSLFHLMPIGVDRTQVKIQCYSPPDTSAQEREMQRINLALLDEVNAEDKTLCERIQRGVRTSGYQPGPLALAESTVYRFHERVRRRLPVTCLEHAPPRGTLQSENDRMKDAATARSQS